MFRHEDFPLTEARILIEDAKANIREQLSYFRNTMGTSPNDPDKTTWETKRQKLRDIYEKQPYANVPDSALYQLLRRRAVLFCNGPGRYGVHPLAVQMLREQYANDHTFTYKGGGLDLLDPIA